MTEWQPYSCARIRQSVCNGTIKPATQIYGIFQQTAFSQCIISNVIYDGRHRYHINYIRFGGIFIYVKIYFEFPYFHI